MKRRVHRIAALATIILTLIMGTGSAATKRQHGAHVHGVAAINIAVEGARAVVEFRAPAESVMGFEHEAKSDGDKKKRDAALERLQNSKEQMVLFDPKWGCKFSPMQTAVVEDASSVKDPGKDARGGKEKKSGEHREVHGTFSVACTNPLGGGRVRFGVSKVFPRIQEIKVQVLSETGQTGATIKKDNGEVRL